MPKSVEEKAREAYESEYGRTSDGKIIYVKDLYSGGFDEFLEIFRRDYNAEGGLIKRVGLRGGKDAAQSDFDPGPGEVSSDAGFDNTGKSQVTEITIGDAPTVFDINKVGDPSQNPKSINVRGGIDYTPSFASPPSFKDNIISKGKSFVKFVSPFLVNAAFGTFVPNKVKKGIALINLAKNLDTIQDMVTEDVLEEDVALTPDGRTGFRGGDAARSDAASGRNAGRADPSGGVDRGPSNRDRAMGSGGKRKGGTNTSRGGGGIRSTTPTSTSKFTNPFSKKNQLKHFRNNQLLKNAVQKGLLTNKEYNILGGYDVTQTLGLGPLDSFVGSLAYNTVQSLKGDQPFGDILGDATRTAQGAKGISPDLKSKYDSIVGTGLKDGGQPKKIPIRSNKYGVKELDYRKSGGFVPIGVKEKADDVPAMLSKNEFVFTADAVRGAGNGSINKGAKKMYNLMKNLEARRV